MSYYVFMTRHEDRDIKLHGPLNRDELINLTESSLNKDITWLTGKNLDEVDWNENKNIGFILEGKSWIPINTPDIIDSIVVNKKLLVRYD